MAAKMNFALGLCMLNSVLHASCLAFIRTPLGGLRTPSFITKCTTCTQPLLSDRSSKTIIPNQEQKRTFSYPRERNQAISYPREPNQAFSYPQEPGSAFLLPTDENNLFALPKEMNPKFLTLKEALNSLKEVNPQYLRPKEQNSKNKLPNERNQALLWPKKRNQALEFPKQVNLAYDFPKDLYPAFLPSSQKNDPAHQLQDDSSLQLLLKKYLGQKDLEPIHTDISDMYSVLPGTQIEITREHELRFKMKRDEIPEFLKDLTKSRFGTIGVPQMEKFDNPNNLAPFVNYKDNRRNYETDVSYHDDASDKTEKETGERVSDEEALKCAELKCNAKEKEGPICACNFNTGKTSTFKNECDLKKHNRRVVGAYFGHLTYDKINIGDFYICRKGCDLRHIVKKIRRDLYLR